MPCLPGYQRMSQAEALLLKLLNEGTKAVAQTEVSVLETSGQAWNRLERTGLSVLRSVSATREVRAAR